MIRKGEKRRVRKSPYICGSRGFYVTSLVLAGSEPDSCPRRAIVHHMIRYSANICNGTGGI
jgi:hypothetical protein